MPGYRTPFLLTLFGLAALASGQASQIVTSLSLKPSTAGTIAGPSIPWDEAFADLGGARPVHFVAQYLDGQSQTHRLEEWRVGLAHLRRRTDDRIDLHADAAAASLPGQPVDYVWQILDLGKKIDHRVTGAGMLRAGMLYSYYSMAHVLSRPSGNFEVHAVDGLAPATLSGMSGRWFEISASGQPSTRVCWLSGLGIPLVTQVETKEGWRINFAVEQLSTRPVSRLIFAVNLKGFKVRNLEDLETDD